MNHRLWMRWIPIILRHAFGINHTHLKTFNFQSVFAMILSKQIYFVPCCCKRWLPNIRSKWCRMDKLSESRSWWLFNEQILTKRIVRTWAYTTFLHHTTAMTHLIFHVRADQYCRRTVRSHYFLRVFVCNLAARNAQLSCLFLLFCWYKMLMDCLKLGLRCK